MPNAKIWGSIPHGDSEFFLWPMLVTRRKTSFSVYQLRFLLQRYYSVGLAVVSYTVSQDVTQRVTSAYTLTGEVFRINVRIDRRFGHEPIQTWVRIDYICVRNDQILWYSSYLLYHQDCWFQSFLYNTFLSVGTRVMALSMKVLYSEKCIENKIINYN